MIITPHSTGFIPDSPDPRDAQRDLILGVGEVPEIFHRELPDHIPYQNGKNECVWCTLAAIQEFSSVAEGNDPELSPRYGYANTPGGSGGRSYRESAQWLRDYGVPQVKYCPNNTSLSYADFLNVSFVTEEGKADAQTYRIKNFSYPSTSLVSLKSACLNQPVAIAIPGNNADWTKDTSEIIKFSGATDWYHSVLMWDWGIDYIGILNWWGDGYRKLALDYPVSAAMSLEDLPNNWKSLNMTITKEQKDLLYKAIFYRDADIASEGYTGQDLLFVLSEFMKSPEWQAQKSALDGIRAKWNVNVDN